MFFVYLLAGAVIPLLITPGLLFHFDTAPKVIVLAVAAAWALLRFHRLPGEIHELRSRRAGRWLVIIAALQLAWFAMTTATSSRPWFSLFGSNWRRFGLIETVSLIVVGVAVAAALAARPGSVKPLLRIVVFAGMVGSIYGIFQYFGLDPLQPAAAYQAHAGDSVIVRPPGTLGHADYFGWWLAIEFFCAIALAANEAPLWKHLATATAVSTFAATLLSGTRAALLGIIAGLVGMALMSGSTLRVRRRHVVTAALALSLFTGFVFSSAGTRLRARAVWSGDEPAGGARPLIWRDSLRMAVDRPLLGFGPETFLTAFARYQSEDLSRLFPDFHHESPHNVPLDALTSMGLPGLLILTAWAVLAGFAANLAQRAGSLLAVPLSAALIASGTAAMFTAASMGPVLLSLLLIGVLIASSPSEAPAANRESGILPWPPRLLAGAVALCLAGFAVILAVGETRLQLFSAHPGEAAYISAAGASLPGASEDLYVSRVLQPECAKRADFQSFLICRQQVMRASGRALSTADDVANAWYNLSMLSASQNEMHWTRKGLEEAARVSPNWFKPHWALARLLSQTGDTRQATAEAARAAFLDANRDAEVAETASALNAHLQ